MIFYRIHLAEEDPSTVLDPRRPDGWVADDESYETQPLGTSATSNLDDLASYVSQYSMEIVPGDMIIELTGNLSPELDRDRYAVRVIVDTYKVLGDAIDWYSAYEYETDDIIDLMDNEEIVPEKYIKWLQHRLNEGWLYDFDIDDRCDVLEFLGVSN